MAYKEVKKQNGMLVKKAVKRIYPETVSVDKKDFIRKRIEDEVFDIEDSVADNAKMISLMATLMSRLYDALDTATKDNLSDSDRQLIEYTFSKFAATNTRADIQFSTEGVAMVDKIFDRQAKIGDIVK